MQPLESREATCVLLRAGTYELTRTLRLSPEDGKPGRRRPRAVLTPMHRPPPLYIS